MSLTRTPSQQSKQSVLFFEDPRHQKGIAGERYTGNGFAEVTSGQSELAVAHSNLMKKMYPLTGLNRNTKIMRAYNRGYFGVASPNIKNTTRKDYMRLVGQEVHSRFHDQVDMLLHSSGVGRGSVHSQNMAKMVSGAEFIGAMDAAKHYGYNIPSSVRTQYNRMTNNMSKK